MSETIVKSCRRGRNNTAVETVVIERGSVLSVSGGGGGGGIDGVMKRVEVDPFSIIDQVITRSVVWISHDDKVAGRRREGRTLVAKSLQGGGGPLKEGWKGEKVRFWVAPTEVRKSRRIGIETGDKLQEAG